jgi:hypothetical protein
VVGHRTRPQSSPTDARSRGSLSRDLAARSESWRLVERYVERYPDDWRLVFRRGDEVLEVSVPEEVWRAFDA